MKLKYILGVLMILFFIFSCGNGATEKGRLDSLHQDSVKKDSMIKAEELKHQTYLEKSDTINFTDKNGLRQGYWKIYGAMDGDPRYRKDELVKEGRYVDGMQEGDWREYFPDDPKLVVATKYHKGKVVQ